MRIANRKKNVRSLVGGSIEDSGQKPHRLWGVGEGGKTHPLDGRDEETAGNADAFIDVVILGFPEPTNTEIRGRSLRFSTLNPSQKCG